jgi:hypothetical protein
MKWYLMVFTRETHVDLAAIHVPGIAEWLEPQYDRAKHRERLGYWQAEAVFRTLAEDWWAQGRGKHGSAQPLEIQRHPPSIGTMIRSGDVKLLEMDMALVPEHKVPQIEAYRSDESEKLRLKAWEPPEGDTAGRWLGIHAMQECDGFAEAIQEMDKMHAECADAIDIQNAMRVKRKEAQLHEWYDELREYVRREHGQEMPPAHRKESDAGRPQEAAVA